MDLPGFQRKPPGLGFSSSAKSGFTKTTPIPPPCLDFGVRSRDQDHPKFSSAPTPARRTFGKLCPIFSWKIRNVFPFSAPKSGNSPWRQQRLHPLFPRHRNKWGQLSPNYHPGVPNYWFLMKEKRQGRRIENTFPTPLEKPLPGESMPSGNSGHGDFPSSHDVFRFHTRFLFCFFSFFLG